MTGLRAVAGGLCRDHVATRTPTAARIDPTGHAALSVGQSVIKREVAGGMGLQDRRDRW